MKFVRYKTNKIQYRGVLDGNKITMISGSLFHEFALSSQKTDVSEVQLLPPILPNKIIGIRKNYEKNSGVPMIFLKPSSSIIGQNDKIILPTSLDKVMIEGELAAIIGKKCKNVSEEKAMNYILGYTIANDITGLSEKFQDGTTSSKYFDTFTPIGPLLDNSFSWKNHEIKTFVNGYEKQRGNTADMFFGVPYLIKYISSIMTLEAGDIILTGTPSPAVEIKNEDKIDITIEGLGTLSNKAAHE